MPREELLFSFQISVYLNIFHPAVVVFLCVFRYVETQLMKKARAEFIIKTECTNTIFKVSYFYIPCPSADMHDTVCVAYVKYRLLLMSLALPLLYLDHIIENVYK